MNLEAYYAAPVFVSSKSTYTVRYLTDFDLDLMKSFDANPDIVDYFQPLMGIILNMPDGKEERVKIDFWLFCSNGLSVWLHVAEPGTSRAEDQIFVLARAGCPPSCVFSVVWPSVSGL